MTNEARYYRHNGYQAINKVFEFTSGEPKRAVFYPDAISVYNGVLIGGRTEACIQTGSSAPACLVEITKAEFDKEFYAALKTIQEHHKE